jgi:hypothetical protein
MTKAELRVGVWFTSSFNKNNYYYITRVHKGGFDCWGYDKDGRSHNTTHNCDYHNLENYTIIPETEVIEIKALMI